MQRGGWARNVWPWALAERLALGEEQQPAREVVAEVLQVRPDGVRAPAKVEVVRKVEGLAHEIARDVELEARVRALGVQVLAQLHRIPNLPRGAGAM